jgi:inosine-uridine nucleoside N-ribohydrolase
LWVVGLGAASNIASALLLDPSIRSKIRLVYHARSEWTWPKRSDQFNVAGDIPAVRAILISGVPLVWFDTGTQLTCPLKETTENLLPLGGMPAFLHQFRYRNTYYQSETKGFFDLGDIAWMMDSTVCTQEVVAVPHMNYLMQFDHKGDLGRMARVHTCKREPVWKLFFERMQ